MFKTGFIAPFVTNTLLKNRQSHSQTDFKSVIEKIESLRQCNKSSNLVIARNPYFLYECRNESVCRLVGWFIVGAERLNAQLK